MISGKPKPEAETKIAKIEKETLNDSLSKESPFIKMCTFDVEIISRFSSFPSVPTCYYHYRKEQKYQKINHI